MEFIPKTSTHSQDVPYFDDVTSTGGWQGHSTKKTIDVLKSEILSAIGRLGGLVTSIQQGSFFVGEVERDGFRIIYGIDSPDGRLLPGRLDVAALPVRQDHKKRKSLETRKKQSLKMALFMLRNAMDGVWFLQQLSPGYAPLMPWMLVDSEKTVTQLWSENAAMGRLLPPGDTDFVEGDYSELEREP